MSHFVLINRMSKDVLLLLKIASRKKKISPSDEAELNLSLRATLYYSVNLVQGSTEGGTKIPLPRNYF